MKFPTADEVSAVTRGAILDSAAFLALDPKTVNEAQPALVSVDGGEVQKGFRLPTGEVVIVAGFDQTVVLPHGNIDVSRATFPMASPNERHVYMDPDQAAQAVKHGSFRQALGSADFNAGYNAVKEPAGHPNDQYFQPQVR